MQGVLGGRWMAGPASGPDGRRVVRYAFLAVLAALVGFGSLWALRPEPGLVQLPRDVERGLDDAVSGTLYPLAQGGQLAPLWSFLDRQGIACRAFEIDDDVIPSSAIACREDGHWVIATLIQHRRAAHGAVGVPYLPRAETALRAAAGERADPGAMNAEEERRRVLDGWD